MAATSKGQNNSTLEELQAQKAIDARNAGWRSAQRGDTGNEERYLRYQQVHAAAFAAGRAAYTDHQEG